MALILAIEPDQRQAAQITGIARHRLNAELILADTTERALDAIGDRVPDLVLIPALLSPQDDAALAAALRVIAAAANVRMLTIPVLASTAPRTAKRAMLGRWRRSRESQTTDGCDPAVFAEQVSTYLAEAVAERAAHRPEPSIAPPDAEMPFGDDVVFEPVVTGATFEPAPSPISFEPAPPAVFFEAAPPAMFEPAASAILAPEPETRAESAASPIFEPAPSPIFEPTPSPIFEWPAPAIALQATPVLIEPPLHAVVEHAVVEPAIEEPPTASVVEPAASVVVEPATAILEPAASVVVEPAAAILEPPASVVVVPAAAIFEPAASVVEPAAAIFEPAASVVVEPAAAIFEPAASVVEPTAAIFEATASMIVEPAAEIPEPAAWQAFESAAPPLLDSPAATTSEPIASPSMEPAWTAFFATPTVDAPPVPSAVEYSSEPDAIVEPESAFVADALPLHATLDAELTAEERFVEAAEIQTTEVEAADLVSEVAIEPAAEAEATILAFQRTASPIGVSRDGEAFADTTLTSSEEDLSEHADLAPQPVADEQLDETAAILAEFLDEPASTIDATILAFHPASAHMEKPAANAFAAFDDTATNDDAVPVQTIDNTNFDVSEFSSDIIEIDLSDETLGHVSDDEPVFELNVDDGDDTFAIADVPAAFASRPAAAQPPAPIAASDDFAGVDVYEPAALVNVHEPEIEFNFDESPAAADLELWMPLSVGAARLWPIIEGVASEYVDPFAPPVAPPAAPKSEHPEWTELIASLRQDMERRREAVEPTPITRVVPRRKAKPVQDEWGFFDPQQCGFAALLAKLDEITEANEEPASRLA